eukprot:12783900-Ditylum_brightwellii.AAC.1
MAVGNFESGFMKDNGGVELNCLMVEYDRMLYNIMSKCKKQLYRTSMLNINSGNNNKQWGNNNGDCRTYIMSTVGDKSFVMGINYNATKQSLRKLSNLTR